MSIKPHLPVLKHALYTFGAWSIDTARLRILETTSRLQQDLTISIKLRSISYRV